MKWIALIACLFTVGCTKTEYIRDIAPPEIITCPPSLTWLPEKPALPSSDSQQLDPLIAAYLVDVEEWMSGAETRMDAVVKQCGPRDDNKNG